MAAIEAGECPRCADVAKSLRSDFNVGTVLDAAARAAAGAPASAPTYQDNDFFCEYQYKNDMTLGGASLWPFSGCDISCGARCEEHCCYL